MGDAHETGSWNSNSTVSPLHPEHRPWESARVQPICHTRDDRAYPSGHGGPLLRMHAPVWRRATHPGDRHQIDQNGLLFSSLKRRPVTWRLRQSACGPYAVSRA